MSFRRTTKPPVFAFVNHISTSLMKGVVQIAKFFGIPVQVHWTFLLIFVWVLAKGFGEAWDWETMAWMMGFVLAIFGCVVLHEFGHALTARRYGVDTRDIILSPIGGVARLDRLPENPVHEFMVAVAGPIVNVVIGVVLSAQPLLASDQSRAKFYNFFMSLAYPNSNIFSVGLSGWDYFLFGLIFLNGILAVFNMVPAFPMDGGRVLRALLSIRLGRLKATRIATYVGQVLAVGLVAFGVWQFSIITAIIGIFVFVMAANEYKMVRFDGILSQHTVTDIMRPQYTPLYSSQPLSAAFELMQHGTERHFLVFDEWHNLAGTLGERKLVKLAKDKKLNADAIPLGAVLRPFPTSLLLADPLDEAYGKVYWKGRGILPVFDQGKLVGVVDENGLSALLKVKQ